MGGRSLTLGERYEEHNRRRGRGFVFGGAERTAALRAFIDRADDHGVVLDLGCRDGSLARGLGLPPTRTVGADIDLEALSAAGAAGVEMACRADLWGPFPFRDDTFSLAVGGEILEHVPFPDDFVAEAARVLRPGGRVVGSVPNAFKLRNRLLFASGRWFEADPTHLRQFSASSLRQLLERHFVDVRNPPVRRALVQCLASDAGKRPGVDRGEALSADQVARFEDRRWADRRQVPVWRHRAAVRLVREEPVLDVGGGDGLLLRMLADRGLRDLSLADLSPVAVERAREAGFGAEVVDITQPLPYEDASFGTVCALDVLEHLYDPLPAVREMARVGRELVLVVPNFHYWRERLRMVAGRVPFQSRPDRGHIHWFNPSTFDALLAEAGLEIMDEFREEPARLGWIGVWLSDVRPTLFASAVAVRARPATSSR